MSDERRKPCLAGHVHIDHPRDEPSRAYLLVDRHLRGGRLDEIELTPSDLVDLLASAATVLKTLLAVERRVSMSEQTAPKGKESQTEQSDSRVYRWSYVESGDVVVTEKDAREHMDRGDSELTEKHWKAAARYLAPEFLEDCLDLDSWERSRS